VLTLFLACFPSATLADETWYTRNNVKIRQSASETSKQLAIIRGGETLTVTGKSGNWYAIRYGSYKGYIRSDLLVQLTRSGYIPLELGNECPQVKEVQNRLYELGYFTGKRDGEFMEDTEDAVKAFQKRNGIKADGIAGGETQRTMFAASAKAAAGQTTSGSSALTPIIDLPTVSAPASVDGVTAENPMKKGETSAQIKTMQTRLRELGYLETEPNGIFGSITEAAVKKFQTANGLTADGKVGPATLTAMNSASAIPAVGTVTSTPTATATSATLKRGDSGAAVKSFQQLLRNLGYITFSPDGVFGSGTETAVVEFQKKNGLTADGKVGSATLAKMSSSSAVPKATATPTSTPSETTTLKRGDSGAEVTKMQKRLKELGYISFSADGEFGSGTRDGVMAFQKNNGLKNDGVAGPTTLSLLYSSLAKKAGTSSGSSSGSSGTSGSTSVGKVRLLHFFNDVKPKYPSGTVVTVTDPITGVQWKLRFMSMGRHADSEPLTAADTTTMNKAFGGIETWTPKAVYVTFPDGVTSLATMHNVQHLSGSLSNNNFDGHLCVHFLRDMEECRKMDPNYGVQHQNAIRKAWKALTGETVN
jgi:peptidoglycan hydrolase-like protein with peptidoglycan-binding domain